MTDTKRPHDKLVEIIIHGSANPNNADVTCPHITWMGEDLVHCPGWGEWKCALQRYTEVTDQYGGTCTDYRTCSERTHHLCATYLKHLEDRHDP